MNITVLAIAGCIEIIVYANEDWKLSLMRIHQRTAVTLLEHSLHVEEAHLDSFQWAFEDIINFTSDVQEHHCRAMEETFSSSDSDSSTTPEPPHRSTNGSIHTQPTASPGTLKHRARRFFLLDNGVIFSLYWAALKSRDGLLRRRAVSLLEQSSQEGVWIGPIQAAIARRVIEIEEEQPYEQYPPPERIKRAEEIPEYIRVHVVGTDIDKLRRCARVVVSQRLQGDEEGWTESVDWVSW